jgi:RHS repeat-associated protein
MTSAKEYDKDPGSGGVLQQEVDFKYDWWGNRLEKDVTVGSTTTVQRYALDGWDPAKPRPVGTENFDVFADLDGTSSLTTRYMHGDAVDQLFARVAADGTGAWLLTDHLGSVVGVTDNSGVLKDTIAYDGYGNIASESASSWGGVYKWTGRQYDPEEKLQYNRGRYYDAATGRWTSQDPLGFGAGDCNLYRYVNNWSTSSRDASGKSVGVFVDGYLNHENNPPGGTTVYKLFKRYNERQEQRVYQKLPSELQFSDNALARVLKDLRAKVESALEANVSSQLGVPDDALWAERMAAYKAKDEEFLKIMREFKFDHTNPIKSQMEFLRALGKATVLDKRQIPIDIVGYSRGATVSIYLAWQLKAEGYNVRSLILIDPVSTQMSKPTNILPPVEHAALLYAGKAADSTFVPDVRAGIEGANAGLLGGNALTRKAGLFVADMAVGYALSSDKYQFNERHKNHVQIKFTDLNHVEMGDDGEVLKTILEYAKKWGIGDRMRE